MDRFYSKGLKILKEVNCANKDSVCCKVASKVEESDSEYIGMLLSIHKVSYECGPNPCSQSHHPSLTPHSDTCHPVENNVEQTDCLLQLLDGTIMCHQDAVLSIKQAGFYGLETDNCDSTACEQ